MASTINRLKGAGWIVDAGVKTVLMDTGEIKQLPLLLMAFDEFQDAQGQPVSAPGQMIWVQYEAALVKLPKRVNVGDRLSLSGNSQLVYVFEQPQLANPAKKLPAQARTAMAQKLRTWLGKRQLTGAKWAKDQARLAQLTQAWEKGQLPLAQWQAQTQRVLAGYDAHTRHALATLQQQLAQTCHQALVKIGVAPLAVLMQLQDVRYRWLTRPLPIVSGRRADQSRLDDVQYHRELTWEVMANRNQRRQLAVPIVDIATTTTRLRQQYREHFPEKMRWEA
ncbi:hypothetical protein ACFQ5J_02490 [Lacticaseibacillus baoqingensis]|uniref:Uncharacterized protein n=1 Tax=Lacticaseibacillus baoqingensis TaxID=2486013 RepID=A0ABW4E6M2_9LACO|nr:hypothetical protein [Lacticaseibacillus baoqingensis]